MSRTSNLLNANFTVIFSLAYCMIQGDPHRLITTGPDPTWPDSRMDPSPDPCPTRVYTCVSDLPPHWIFCQRNIYSKTLARIWVSHIGRAEICRLRVLNLWPFDLEMTAVCLWFFKILELKTCLQFLDFLHLVVTYAVSMPVAYARRTPDVCCHVSSESSSVNNRV